MIQFYFLSIICNALAGYALITDSEAKSSIFDGIRSYVLDETFRLVLGVLTMVVGFFKILSVIRGDIPVIGDLLPAITGLSAGFSLLFEFYKTRSTVIDEQVEKIESFLATNRKWVGYAALVSAGAHFLFPTVLFF
ncbi:hypothetical protein [Gracilinema caldarium]|uniref:hypothetical protein n=1 Tax=Gracilinema caldarium TaxID=215591 RepID=UPI0026EB69F2|nr:hypothetical protein [Gracilinema caldarium]